MKKAMLVFIIILCTCGVGFLGYMIFNSKNIENVELAGSMQSLYIVGDEIDYEDAKLKVTYKNGNIKMVNLSSSSVKVQGFSTSVERYGNMKLVYKSATLDVDYIVIQKGAYYLSNYESKELAQTNSNQVAVDNKSYDYNNTKEILNIENGGVCSYYVPKSAGSSEWVMHDGNYDKKYSYSIEGDTLTAKLNETNYEIQAVYDDNGKILLKSKKLTVMPNTELIRKQEVKTFLHTDQMKSSQSVNGIEVCYGSNFSTSGSVECIQGKTFDESGAIAYIKATYAQYNTGHPFKSIYIAVHDGMFNRNFDTSHASSQVKTAYISYGGLEPIAFHYTVKAS